MMIMSGADSSLFSLNETASILWQAADGVTPLAQIVERHICEDYAVDPATALRDAEALSEDLARHGILLLSDARNGRQGTQAGNSAERATGFDLSLQRALRALLSRSRRPWRDDNT